LTLVAVSSLALVLSAGCSSGKTTGPTIPPYTPPATTSSSPTPAASASPSHAVPPTPLTYTPADPDHIGAWSVTPAYQATTPQAQQVFAAWTVYEQARFQAFNQRKIDFKVLDQIATGNTRRSILQMVGERIKGTVGGQHVAGGLFTVGQSTTVIQDITVKGKTATVVSCGDDQSYEVDLHGKTIIPAPGVALVRENLVLVKGRWLVTSQPVYTASGCTMPKATS
jgi:hypothetical protein